MGKSACESASVVRLAESKNSSEVRHHDEIFKKILSRECLLGSVPCCLAGCSLSRSWANMWNSSVSMAQLNPQMASSLVLPLGVPPLPTVEAVVLVAKAFVRRTRHWWK